MYSPHGQSASEAQTPGMMSMSIPVPPSHTFLYKKPKPPKPYGPSFVTTMNRTWRGPGQKYIKYALVAFSASLIFLTCAGVYIGHRNVGRVITRRTEVFGAIFIILFVAFWGLGFHYIYKARMASNRWRNYVRFRAEGLCTAVAINPVYNPEDGKQLVSNTFTTKGLTQVPNNRRFQRRSRRMSGRSTPRGHLSVGRSFDQSMPEKVMPTSVITAGPVDERPRYVTSGPPHAYPHGPPVQYSQAHRPTAQPGSLPPRMPPPPRGPPRQAHHPYGPHRHGVPSHGPPPHTQAPPPRGHAPPSHGHPQYMHGPPPRGIPTQGPPPQGFYARQAPPTGYRQPLPPGQHPQTVYQQRPNLPHDQK